MLISARGEQLVRDPANTILTARGVDRVGQETTEGGATAVCDIRVLNVKMWYSYKVRGSSRS